MNMQEQKKRLQTFVPSECTLCKTSLIPDWETFFGQMTAQSTEEITLLLSTSHFAQKGTRHFQKTQFPRRLSGQDCTLSRPLPYLDFYNESLQLSNGQPLYGSAFILFFIGGSWCQITDELLIGWTRLYVVAKVWTPRFWRRLWAVYDICHSGNAIDTSSCIYVHFIVVCIRFALQATDFKTVYWIGKISRYVVGLSLGQGRGFIVNPTLCIQHALVSCGNQRLMTSRLTNAYGEKVRQHSNAGKQVEGTNVLG